MARLVDSMSTPVPKAHAHGQVSREEALPAIVWSYVRWGVFLKCSCLRSASAAARSKHNQQPKALEPGRYVHESAPGSVSTLKSFD